MAYDSTPARSMPFTLSRQLPNGVWTTKEAEAAGMGYGPSMPFELGPVVSSSDREVMQRWRREAADREAKAMSGFARNNLCAMDGLTGQPIDPRDVPNSPVGGGPAERIKSFLAQRLTPSDLREFEALIATLQGGEVGAEGEGDDEEGQEVAHPVRTTGPIGVVPGTRMRDRGDPVGEDDDLGVLTARGPTDARGRRVPVSGLPKGALDRRRAQAMANDQVRREARLVRHAEAAQAVREYESRWPGRYASKCDV
jgi:hypothetical protein